MGSENNENSGKPNSFEYNENQEKLIKMITGVYSNDTEFLTKVNKITFGLISGR